MENEKLYDARSVSARLGINPDTLYKYLRKGLIQGSFYARKWHISESQIQAFLVQQQTRQKEGR